MNELLDKIERIDQGVDRLIADRKLLTEALLRVGSDLGALSSIASKLDDTVALREYAALQGVVTAALEQVGRP